MKKEKSISKIALGVMTCGLSLPFTGVNKKQKPPKTKLEFNDSFDNEVTNNFKESKINEDYQKTVFLYTQKNKPLKSQNEYPRYTSYELGITNPRKYHESMINQGYLELNNEKYALTEKGKKYIDEYYYCVLLHQNKYLDISVDEYNKEKDCLPSYLKFNDIVWNILNKRLNEGYLNHKYGTYRNAVLNMSKILYQEKKYTDCLYYTLKVLHVDLSGCFNEFLFAPFVINKIVELKDYFTDDIANKVYKIKFPTQVCDEQIFKEILNDIFNEPVFNEEKYIKILEKRKENVQHRTT